MDEEYISTEYLIMHEDEVDWEALSKDPNRPLSLVEARLFRRHINWRKYITTHKNSLTTDFLEVGSKYFNETIYHLLSYSDTTPEEFILKHKDKCNVCSYILNSKPSQEFLLETLDCWKDNDVIRTAIPIKINLEDPEYKEIRLLYEVE